MFKIKISVRSAGICDKHLLQIEDVLVFRVGQGARLCQGHQVAQHDQERGPQLWQTMTSWFQEGQEVLEALVDQEDPRRNVLFILCFIQHVEFTSAATYISLVFISP